MRKSREQREAEHQQLLERMAQVSADLSRSLAAAAKSLDDFAAAVAPLAKKLRDNPDLAIAFRS